MRLPTPLPLTLEEARQALESHRFRELDRNVTADHADRLAEALRVALERVDAKEVTVAKP